ncbi:MAG: WYL domain-containing protein [Arachnia sp.]
MLRFDYLAADGRRADPGDPDFTAPARVEPHDLVMWAGRWYLVAHNPARGEWAIYRVERIHPLDPTGVWFPRRELPARSVAEYVMTSHDRGDTPASWQCLGSVVMALPAEVVARWAPGGSVVDYVDPGRSRMPLGAWSWAGVAGLLATFDADITDVEPAELRQACQDISERYGRTAASPARRRAGQQQA